MWIRTPTMGDLLYLAQNMRPRDAAEIFALRPSEDRIGLAYQVFAMLPRAMTAFVCGLDSDPNPTAFLAVWATEETGGLACANLFATADFPAIAAALVRHVRHTVIPALLTRGCRRVECRASATYRTTQRFIRACGAVQEAEMPDYGKSGETFMLFAWTRSAMREAGYVPDTLGAEATGS